MNDLQNLIQLQKIDSQLQEITDLLGDLPAKVEKLRLEEQDLIGAVEQGELRLKAIDFEIGKLGLKEQEYIAKIDKYKNQLYLVTNNKQYDALMHEIDHLKNELDHFETSELELREEKSTLEEATKSKSMNLDSLRDDLHQRIAKLEEMIAENDEHKRELDQKRIEQVKEISASVMSRYERIYAARDGVVVVSLKGSACGGCGSLLTRQIAAEIKAGKDMKICDVCSRFLYWKE